MKLDFNREVFSSYFHIAAMVAPTRSPKAILQYVKLVASANSLEIMTNDMEVGVKLRIPDVEIKQPGEAVIPVSRLSLILRESNDDRMTISSQESKILITGKNSKFQLLGQNPEEYPDVDGIEEGEYYEVISHVMKELIKRTIFATDTESSRYQMGGVLLEFEDEKLTAVGTDGKRLAKMEGPMKTVGKPEGAGTTIVPARSMQLIERMLTDGEEVIKIVPKVNKLLIGDANGIFKTQLVEGRFPNWRGVIPNRQTSTKIMLPVGPFYSALRQAAIVTNEESRSVNFTFEQGTVVLSNQTAEVGESRIEMPVAYDGAVITIALDNRYVADFLKVLPPESMFTLDIQDSDQAAFCSTEDNYGYVIMPVQKGK